MRRAFLFSVFCLINLFTNNIYAQEVEKLYTGRGYWYEEQNERYQAILMKKGRDEVLSSAEEQWFDDYHTYLKDFFSKLSESEKDKYFENKEKWDAEKSGIYLPEQEIADKKSSEDQLTPIPDRKRYHMWNGLYGLMYGTGLTILLAPNEEAIAWAFPIIGTGLGFLWQELNPERYENISINSVLLARHGKFMGAINGAALGLTIMGSGDAKDGKVALGLGILGSFTGAEIGYRQGEKLDWTDGKVATLKYYGTLTPAINFFTLGALRAEDARIYGATQLVTNATGYWIGIKMADHFNNTRGDMVAISSFTAVSTGLLAGVLPFNNTYELFIPISGAILSTYAGHMILKNKKISPSDGWRINYVTAAGAFLGFGTAIISTLHSRQGIFILTAMGGGLGWYAKYRSVLRNMNSAQILDPGNRNYFSLDFNPENYYFNKSTWKLQSETFNTGLPIVGLKYHF